MKLQKSLLTALIAGATITLTTVSCEKERVDPEKQNENEEPKCGFEEEDDTYCPPCGMG